MKAGLKEITDPSRYVFKKNEERMLRDNLATVCKPASHQADHSLFLKLKPMFVSRLVEHGVDLVTTCILWL